LYYSPDGYHIASVDLLPTDHDFFISSLSINDEVTIVCVPLNTPATLYSSLKHLVADPDTSIPRHAAASPLPLLVHLQKLLTESWVDASLPGGTFKKTSYIGFGICNIIGTCAFPLCQKAPTPAKNTM
jgi:hypothetical protein